MTDHEIKFSNGASYDRTTGAWSRIAGSQFLDWLAPAPGQKWVDIGCGTGAFTEQIIQNCSPLSVEGVDPSLEQIQYASGNPEIDLANFRTGDAMDLPFKVDQFDIATMALVLFFVPDPEIAVSEMKRVVRPGGTIAGYVWDVVNGGLHLEPFHVEFRRLNISYPLPPSAQISKMETLEKLWSESGLTSIRTKRFKVERIFSSFEELWNFGEETTALAPVLKSLDQKIIENIKAGLKTKIPPADDGSVKYSAYVNAIQGRG